MGTKSLVKVGSYYEFTMMEGDSQIQFWGTVATYEHPLIKLEDTEASFLRIADETGETLSEMKSGPYPGRIINVTSPAFVGAIEKQR